MDSPLLDWAILQLSQPCQVKRVILDTRHFKGNYPESVRLEGCCNDDDNTNDNHNTEWFPLVKRTCMSPHAEHVFEIDQLEHTDRFVTRVRLSIYPDGGVSRVRVYGLVD